ncbi:MAG: glycosyltransferase [Chthoniobacterales bacterium]
MKSVLPISVCIPARNESTNLPACLESLGDNFAQVVVVDSQSNDATRDIAAASGA